MALMLLFIPGAFAVETQDIDAGLTPDSPFYFMDRWGESLSLAFTLNDEGKAVKHLEFAQERLSEMQEVEQIDKIEDLQENFNKNLENAQQRREKIADKENAILIKDENIEKLRARNQEILTELKGKLPEEAQKGIENAIANSQNAKSYTAKEKQQHRIANQDMMMNKFLKEFEGKTFKIEYDGGMKFYRVESGEIKEGMGDSVDYTIKINDEDKAKKLYSKYEKGDVITYDEVTEVFDVPLRLQGRLVSIVGIGGLK